MTGCTMPVRPLARLAEVLAEGRDVPCPQQCAIHEAVSKSTENDIMSWVMRHAPLFRQTCRHAAEYINPVPTIASTKDGR